MLEYKLITLQAQEEVIHSIDSCRASHSKNMVVLGSSGGGKTTIAREYVRRNPTYKKFDNDGKEIAIVPVIHIYVPNPFNLGDFYRRILSALGDRVLKAIPAEAAKLRIVELLCLRGVEVVLYDEVQNIMYSKKTMQDAMIELMDISNQTSIPFVAFGLPESVTILEFVDMKRTELKTL